ncbi:hypothetical protein A2154_01445 [Candidatus Gottesmanbacteria bacterium RBG_16_43_7]|uniref:Uncharacterized protein n=1 Tax=Candidatus Gottesmanbacteria bacterium RBG_16_43_7 TaxID=1798373 RepID=A0A1F5ZB61_9BACT|nr:MAG: hypothetical protein A2154_01445 [Candidatus Gottesmanbacteria bacterium RBG_16_43_7]
MKLFFKLLKTLFGKFRSLRFWQKAILVALIIVVGWFVYLNVSAQKNSQIKYQTATVQKGDIVSTVSASGSVLSVNIISANSLASGIIKSVFVKDGDVVKNGDKILEIDLDFQGQQKYAQAWASYLSAKSSLAQAQATEYTLRADLFTKWDTFKNLAENDTYSNADDSPKLENRTLPEFLISQNNWLAAEAKYKNQQTAVSQAQAALNSAWLTYLQSSPVVTAPADGTITSLMYAPGMSIGTLDTGTSSSNEKVATIATSGTPIVSVNLSEIDVSKVKIGQKVTLSLDSIENTTFTGIVIGVDRIGQTSNGVTQYPAIIQLDLENAQILPNMTVTANILLSSKNNVLTLPAAALIQEDGQSYVKVPDGKGSRMVAVEVGISSDTMTEIVSGLSVGDTVITGNGQTTQSQQSTSPFNTGFGPGMRIAR